MTENDETCDGCGYRMDEHDLVMVGDMPVEFCPGVVKVIEKSDDTRDYSDNRR